MAKEKIVVSLTGGLGNQLFQLSVGMSLTQESHEDIVLETGIGKPRLNKFGDPELSSFQLPKGVKFDNNRTGSWLVRKSLGYVLRMGVTPRYYEKSKLVASLISALSGCVGAIYFRGYRTLVYGEGVGFFEMKKTESRQVLIGYFQSEYWPNQVYETLMEIKPNNGSKKFQDLKRKFENEDILAVHIRRGDYEAEDSFGLLTRDYYVEAINELLSKKSFSSIWVFTDSPNEIPQYFPPHLSTKIFIAPEELDTAETFELMRYAKAYIIANSTFSWWAAYLSYAKNAIIYAPDPWFKNIQDPARLIPASWEKRPGH